MRVLIVDDEPFARDELGFLLSEFEEIEVIGCACDGLEAGQLIHSLAPEVVFCDIEMPGLTGLELAKMFSKTAIHWVFVTAYDHHALSAFDVQAVDYLVKPVEPERLGACLERLQARLPKPENDRLVGRLGARWIMVPKAQLRYVYSDGLSVNLVAEQQSHSDLSLKALIEQAGLLQCHRQYAINVQQVKELTLLDNGNAQVLMGEDWVPVSRRYLKAIKTALGMG